MKRERVRGLAAAILQCVLIASVTQECFTQQPGGTCRYRYTQQPPRNLPCNAYTTGRLITRCEVSFGQTEESVNLQWVFVPFDTVTVSILASTGSKYTITPGSSTSLVFSQLRVETLSDSDAGSYYCQVRFSNGSLAEPSQELDLFSSAVFAAQQLSPCSQFATQAVREELCALTGQVDDLQGVSPGGGSNNGGGGGGTSNGGDTNGDGDSGGDGTLGAGSGDIVLYSIIGGVVFFFAMVCILVTMAIFCSIWINRINTYT